MRARGLMSAASPDLMSDTSGGLSSNGVKLKSIRIGSSQGEALLSFSFSRNPAPKREGKSRAAERAIGSRVKSEE